MEKLTLLLNKGVQKDGLPGLIPEGYAADARHVFLNDGVAYKMPGWASFYDTADTNYINGLYRFMGSDGTIYTMSGTKTTMAKIVSGVKTNLKTDYNGYDIEGVAQDATPWSFASFGSHILFTNGIDPPQKFIPNYSAVAAIGGSPPDANVVRVFQRHAFLLGMDTYPFRVMWSDIDDYEMWTPASDNEAGDLDLYESKTWTVGADGLGDLLVVYTGSQIHVFQYVGGTFIFNRRIADWNVGLWKKNLVATGAGVQGFMSPENFYAFDGVQAVPIGDRINKEIYAALDTTQMSRGFAFPVMDRAEIWFCVPTAAGDGTVDLACIWNWRNGAWSFEDLGGWFSAIPKVLPNLYPLFSPNDKKIYSLGNTENGAGVAVTGYIDSPEFGDPNAFFTIDHIEPEIESSAAAIKFKVGTRNNINESVTWGSAHSFDPDVDTKVDIREGGKLCRLRVYTDTLNSPFKLGRITVYYTRTANR